MRRMWTIEEDVDNEEDVDKKRMLTNLSIE